MCVVLNRNITRLLLGPLAVIMKLSSQKLQYLVLHLLPLRAHPHVILKCLSDLAPLSTLMATALEQAHSRLLDAYCNFLNGFVSLSLLSSSMIQLEFPFGSTDLITASLEVFP